MFGKKVKRKIMALIDEETELAIKTRDSFHYKELTGIERRIIYDQRLEWNAKIVALSDLKKRIEKEI